MKKILFLLALTAQSFAAFVAKDYGALLGTPGFSDEALKMHFALYNGYVTNANKLMDEMTALSADGKVSTPEWAELRRRFGWEWDGMRLHELYFENMGGTTPLAETDPLALQIAKDFGSYDEWKADFIATGAMRGIGWAILYWDKQSGRLYNTWINEHDVGHLAGGTPILVMDVFEHAYLIDYKLARAKYIDAFFAIIKWKAASQRFTSNS